MSIFAVTFFVFGSCASVITTAPLPGLGPPHPTYWGIGWSESKAVFVTWNLIGLTFLLASILLLVGRKETPARRIRLLAIGACAYLAGIAPYLACGAYLHGWSGGYVRMYCGSARAALGEAICDYIDGHEGTLPAAKDMEELVKCLEPYLKKRSFGGYFAPGVCPIKSAFARTPHKYQWDAELSGRRVVDLDPERLMQEGLIRCPDHKGWAVPNRLLIMIIDQRSSRSKPG